MPIFISCVHKHASLSCLNPSWFFPTFLEDSNSKVSWTSPFLGSLGILLTKARLSFSFPFSPFLRPRACLFIGLGFLFTYYKWALVGGLGLPYL